MPSRVKDASGVRRVAGIIEKQLKLLGGSALEVRRKRSLEIAFKNGQVWQLFGVPPDVYQELLNATFSSFLKFIARRYGAAPVRKSQPVDVVPETEPCPHCQASMQQR